MSLCKTEEKFMKLSLNTELLNLYRNSNFIPQGFRLNFKLELLAKNGKL